MRSVSGNKTGFLNDLGLLGLAALAVGGCKTGVRPPQITNPANVTDATQASLSQTYTLATFVQTYALTINPAAPSAPYE